MSRNWIGVAQDLFHYSTLPGKILRLPLKILPSNMGIPILSGKLRGKRWIVGSGIHRYWFGTYELEKQELFAKIISPEDVVFDVGANVGFYSLLASVLVGHQGRVFAFEPVQRNIKYLRQHLQINHINNVEVLEVAVSDKSGYASFDFSQNASTGHFSELGAEQVKTVTIDYLVEAKVCPPPQIIKIDIEGAEFLALMGTQKTISKYHPIIFLATHGKEVHTLSCDILSSWGYTLTPLDFSDLTQAREILATHSNQN